MSNNNGRGWEPFEKGQTIPSMQGLSNIINPHGGATVPTMQRVNTGGKSPGKSSGKGSKK